MRDLHAAVSGHTAASPESALALLNDVDAYPSWYPTGVKQTDVRERDADGLATKIFAILALDKGPIQRDFDMEMAVTRGDDWVMLSRIPKGADDKQRFAVTFRVTPGTELTAEFDATLPIPGFLPLGGVEKAVPQGFLDAAIKQLGA